MQQVYYVVAGDDNTLVSKEGRVGVQVCQGFYDGAGNMGRPGIKDHTVPSAKGKNISLSLKN